jgi:hypothetical protein
MGTVVADHGSWISLAMPMSVGEAGGRHYAGPSPDLPSHLTVGTFVCTRS